MALVARNSVRNDNGTKSWNRPHVHFMTLRSMGKVYIVDITHHIRAGKYVNMQLHRCALFEKGFVHTGRGSLLSRHAVARYFEPLLSVSRHKRRHNVLKDMNKRLRERSKCEVVEPFCRIDMWVCRLEVVINMRKIRGSWGLHRIIGERPIIKPIRRYWKRLARCRGTVGPSLMFEWHRSRPG